MPYSKERVNEIALAYFRNNEDELKTAIELNIKPSSIERVMRKFREEDSPIKVTPAKIFFTDIETAQMIVKVWGLFKQRIPHHRIVKDWFIMMWAGKWALSNEVVSGCVTGTEARERDDSRILKDLWEVINDADIIVGHNVERFDLRKINDRWWQYGIKPPSQYQIVDTLKHAKRNFAMSSYKLDYITKHLQLPTKLKTDIELWDDCEDGNEKRLAEMLEYCENDVVISEEVYWRMLPWMKSHPNMGLFDTTNGMVCPNCASSNLTALNKFYVTPVNKYPAFRCEDCGKPSHSKHTVICKEKGRNVLRSSSR